MSELKVEEIKTEVKRGIEEIAKEMQQQSTAMTKTAKGLFC